MKLYEQYKAHLRKIADLKNAQAVLQWDQEVYLSPAGASFRGQQLATLSEQTHALSTDERLGAILRELLNSKELNEPERKNVILSWEDFSKQKKYSPEFVRSMSEAVSKCFHRWIEARKQNSFSVFEKDLDHLITLKKQEAGILGYSAHPYDALLNEYEKNCTVSLLNKTFSALHPSLKELLTQIISKKQVDDSFLHQFYPKQKQWEFGMSLIRKLGFDFEAGRQDVSEHPFTSSFNRNDVRITTRIDENNFGNMTWSCIHETGHALYEQGLPESEYGLPSGEYASLGIHESQSRLWENNVGRSLGFWSHEYADAKTFFPDQLSRIGLYEFYKGINKVEPSLIRTEADELTYHFHVMIRYELEKQLIEGTVSTHDIPVYWNDLYEKYLGVKVPDDKRGCLQDVHWSHGSFGYFPTYSLGSLYAAQLFAAANNEVPGLVNKMEMGDTSDLLAWLKRHIYPWGRLFTSEELCRKVTGEGLNTHFFLDYLLDKYGKIYDL